MSGLHSTNGEAIKTSKIVKTPQPLVIVHPVPATAKRSWPDADKPRAETQKEGQSPEDADENRESVLDVLRRFNLLDEQATPDLLTKLQKLKLRDEGACEPVPMPDDVQKKVQALDGCGRHICRDYSRADASSASSVSGVSRASRGCPPPASEMSPTACRDCRLEFPPSVLHRLACGHGLCSGCLQAAVAPTIRLMRFSLGTLVGSHSCSSWPDVVRAIDMLQAAMQMGKCRPEHAAFLCCGQNMYIDLQLASTRPEPGSCWVLDQAERSYSDEELEALVCGWPDCHSVVSKSCAYKDGQGNWVFYCVHCRANSISQDERLVPTS